MAGAKVPAPLDPMGTAASWTNILARLEKTYKGYEGVSLTNWAAANTDRPEIAAGSVIEIDGAPFEYATDDTIADEGGLTDGWCYVKHVVSGDTVTATLTNTFGTWDTAKQGFYDGSGNRFSLFAMYRSGAITKIYTEKHILGNYISLDSDVYSGQAVRHKVVSFQILNGGSDAYVDHGLVNAYTNHRILNIYITVKNTASSVIVCDGYAAVAGYCEYYNNTQMRIVRNGTVGTLTCYAYIDYI